MIEGEGLSTILEMQLKRAQTKNPVTSDNTLFGDEVDDMDTFVIIISALKGTLVSLKTPHLALHDCLLHC